VLVARTAEVRRRCAPEAPWTARSVVRESHRNSSRNAHSEDCWSRSACICAREVSAEKTRIAARPAASTARSCGRDWLPAGAPTERRWRGAQRRAAPRTGCARRAAASARSTAVRQARVLAVASARRRPLRLKPGDSRSPDRTSATRGFLCRSGYTSPTIAQSLVPHFHYFKLGVE